MNDILRFARYAFAGEGVKRKFAIFAYRPKNPNLEFWHSFTKQRYETRNNLSSKSSATETFSRI